MEIITREHLIRIHIIEISGRLEAFTVAQPRDQQTRLINGGGKNFIVDLSKTSFMDSAGMSALVSLLKQSRHAGGEVVLVKPTDPAAYRILALTRFDRVFTIVDTIEAAVRQF